MRKELDLILDRDCSRDTSGVPNYQKNEFEMTSPLMVLSVEIRILVEQLQRVFTQG